MTEPTNKVFSNQVLWIAATPLYLPVDLNCELKEVSPLLGNTSTSSFVALPAGAYGNISGTLASIENVLELTFDANSPNGLHYTFTPISPNLFQQIPGQSPAEFGPGFNVTTNYSLDPNCFVIEFTN